MTDKTKPLTTVAQDVAALRAIADGAHAIAETPAEALAYDLGAKGSPAIEQDRLAFEAWMRGHCWALSATWIDGGYRGDRESKGRYCADAARTRMLWAAWRDRGELARRLRPARVPEGWQLVPKKATHSMFDAFRSATAKTKSLTERGWEKTPRDTFDAQFSALLAAAPAAEGVKADGDAQNDLTREDLVMLLVARLQDIGVDESEFRIDGLKEGDTEIGDWLVTVVRTDAHLAPESREAQKCRFCRRDPAKGCGDEVMAQNCGVEPRCLRDESPEAGQREGVEALNPDDVQAVYTAVDRLAFWALAASRRLASAQPILSRDAGDVSNASAQQAGTGSRGEGCDE